MVNRRSTDCRIVLSNRTKLINLKRSRDRESDLRRGQWLKHRPACTEPGSDPYSKPSIRTGRAGWKSDLEDGKPRWLQQESIRGRRPLSHGIFERLCHVATNVHPRSACRDRDGIVAPPHGK